MTGLGRFAVFITLITLTACGGPAFYEKQNLADPVMEFDDGSAETHFYQKIYHSREGSAGGIGTGSGGGCGCY